MSVDLGRDSNKGMRFQQKGMALRRTLIVLIIDVKCEGKTSRRHVGEGNEPIFDTTFSQKVVDGSLRLRKRVGMKCREIREFTTFRPVL